MTDNPMRFKAGNTTRSCKMLDYFERHSDILEVTFLTLNSWTTEEKDCFQKRYSHINLAFFTAGDQFSKKTHYSKYLLYDKIPRILSNEKSTVSLLTPFVKKQLTEHFSNSHFDVLIVSYAYWAELIDFIPADYRIIDTHDFLTAQHAPPEHLDIEQVRTMFGEELRLLQKFDEVWTYSLEEHYLFEQFLKNTVKLVPLSFNDNTHPVCSDKKYQITYVASANHHNVDSINWFLEKVLPQLKQVQITMVGKICEVVPNHPQVQKLGLVADLDQIYRDSLLTICPMLSGTGVKIKVLESLSYGLPVVTTRRGVDGLVNKQHNGCLVSNDETSFAQYILKLIADQTFYNQIQQEAIRYFTENHHPQLEEQFLNERVLKYLKN